jgi:poly(3-hydroxybutyrate) depolymerase
MRSPESGLRFAFVIAKRESKTAFERLSTRWLPVALAALLGVLCLPASGAGPKGTTHVFVIPKQNKLYADPTYYCWVPDSLKAARAVIVHHHGCTREGDAQMMMNDVQWKTFAKKWDAVFIAPKMISGPPGKANATTCQNFYVPENGSDNTFLAALDSLAARTGHPEIRTAPWALWGHSAGSFWSTGMLRLHPDRIAGVVAQSCGFDVSQAAGVLKVPVLHHNGKQDLCYNDTLWSKGRARGGLWAHAVNPFVTWAYNPNKNAAPMMGHAPGNMREIAIPWLDIVLSERLPAPGQASLRDMDTAAAWLGDAASGAILPSGEFAGNKAKASWFPNRHFAEKWKEYMAAGSIRDTLPPPMPYRLTGTYSGQRLRLDWDADADLETGIKTFVIYRDGNPYDTLEFPSAPANYFTLEKGFQRWNDGDQPIPSVPPAMTYTDAAVSGSGTYVYQVGTVNWSGLAGPKSPALLLKNGQTTAIARDRAQAPAPGRQAVSNGWGFRAWKSGRASDRDEAYDARGALIFESGKR